MNVSFCYILAVTLHKVACIPLNSYIPYDTANTFYHFLYKRTSFWLFTFQIKRQKYVKKIVHLNIILIDDRFYLTSDQIGQLIINKTNSKWIVENNTLNLTEVTTSSFFQIHERITYLYSTRRV